MPHKGASEPAVDTCCLSPCGTRADLVATNVAAQAGARPHATHNAVNTVLQQSLYQLNLDGNEDRVYRKYMDNHAGFMEKDLSVH